MTTSQAGLHSFYSCLFAKLLFLFITVLSSAALVTGRGGSRQVALNNEEAVPVRIIASPRGGLRRRATIVNPDTQGPGAKVLVDRLASLQEGYCR